MWTPKSNGDTDASTTGDDCEDFVGGPLQTDDGEEGSGGQSGQQISR